MSEINIMLLTNCHHLFAEGSLIPRLSVQKFMWSNNCWSAYTIGSLQ